MNKSVPDTMILEQPMNTSTIANTEQWDIIITPRRSLLDLNLKEVWQYRDLMVLFVRRDLVAQYKQTLLGPLWYFIQPLFTTLIFTVIFGRLAGISTNGVPPMLFYLAGITCWNYFAECLNRTSGTFRDNQGIFGKVYFPRLTVPLSVIISSLIKFGIQFLLFLAFYVYFLAQGAAIQPNAAILLFPLLIILFAGLGLGFGLLITAMTTKYRDLVFLVQFGVQLAMYATPIIYPLSAVPPQYQWLVVLNPMTSLIETFKYSFLGQGVFSWTHLAYSAGFTVVLLLLSIIAFNRTERTFMDTV